MARLKAEFEKNGGGFKEWKIGKLFQQAKKVKVLNKLQLDKNGIIPVYSSDTSNGGVIGYCDHEPQFIVDEKTPFYLIFGDHTRAMNFAEKDFCIADNVKVLIPNYFSQNVVLYICTIWKKGIRNLGYARHWSIAKNCILSLPTLSTGKLAFDYMEAYIRELEEIHIQDLQNDRDNQLQAYLNVCDLDDYHLTATEQTAIDLLRNGKVEMREFRIGELFEKISAKYLGKGNKFKVVSREIRDHTFNIPLVYAKRGNNGIMYYAKKGDFETHKNVLSVIYNGAVAAGLVYAHSEETGILAESYFIKIRDKEISFEACLFLKTIIEKVIYPKYSRDYLATWTNKVENDIISLPVLSSGEIDYAFMQHYISAVQKIAIKNVVLWKDRQIAATEKIVATAADRNGNAALSVCTKDSIANAL